MYKYRLQVLLILIFGGCLMVATRLFYLQIIQGDYWKDYANHVLLSKRSLPTYQGKVFTADGTLLAADMPGFDIAARLADLDPPVKNPDGKRPRAEFRRRLDSAFVIDGHRVKDARDVHLALAAAGGDQWCVNVSYSGTLVRRERPPPVIGLLWGGRTVREQVSRHATVAIPDTVVGPVKVLAQAAGRTEAQILGSVVQLAEDELAGRAGRAELRPLLADAPYDLVLKTEVFADAFRGFSPMEKRPRRYPQGDLAGHVIGYMGKLTQAEYDRYRGEYCGSRAKRYFLSDTIGKTGTELWFNDVLRGARGEELVERDSHGRAVREPLSRIASVPGSDVYLTLLAQQQRAAEQALGGRTGAAVVMDVATGEILVLASSPRFNPATISEDYPKLLQNQEKPFVHRAIKAYPLGSTFKIVTALAAWATGVDTDCAFTCEGFFRIGRLRCSGYHNEISFHEAMKRSCNVYFCELGMKAGAEGLYEWARNLGFDQQTTFELGGEDAGYVPSPARRHYEQEKDWYAGDTANLSIGQGELMTTPLQAARAMAMVANGGRLVMPHIVKRIVDAGGSEVPVKGRPSIEPKTAAFPPGAGARLRSALTAVVHEEHGTAWSAFEDWRRPWRVAGKTSTAQRRKADPQSGLPYWDDVGWFVGFAPADRPRVAFTVMIEHLSSGMHGGELAAPIARAVLESFSDDFMLGKAAAAGGAPSR